MSFAASPIDFANKQRGYAELAQALTGLLTGERNRIANAANTAALLFDALPAVNWTGFYFAQGRELVIGPFQGKPACVRIAFGRGVCGRAAADRLTVVVPDVNAFPGHIACDSASRSEIVVPLVRESRLIGVLDVDSPELARFDQADRLGLERIAELFLAASD
ncbi:MAG TPA: GAF domain-containing protein [Steroidobacteraceae bacterium]|nr:GAF domain-containing protein [Steroidobacteraceae bacterium]